MLGLKKDTNSGFRVRVEIQKNMENGSQSRTITGGGVPSLISIYPIRFPAQKPLDSYAATGERIVWIPESELELEEVAAAAQPSTVIHSGRAGTKWPIKGKGTMVTLRRGAPMGG